MNLKFFNSDDFKSVSKLRLYREAFKEACAALVLDGRFSSYQSARNAMIKRATSNILNKSNSKKK